MEKEPTKLSKDGESLPTGELENSENYFQTHKVLPTPAHETEIDYSELPCDVDLVEAFEGGLQILIGVEELERRGF